MVLKRVTTIEAVLAETTLFLHKTVADLPPDRRQLLADRHKAFGELSNELRRQHEGLNALSEHTQQLREALANSPGGYP